MQSTIRIWIRVLRFESYYLATNAEFVTPNSEFESQIPLLENYSDAKSILIHITIPNLYIGIKIKLLNNFSKSQLQHKKCLHVLWLSIGLTPSQIVIVCRALSVTGDKENMSSITLTFEKEGRWKSDITAFTGWFFDWSAPKNEIALKNQSKAWLGYTWLGGMGSNNQNGNLRWFLPGGGGGGVSS